MKTQNWKMNYLSNLGEVKLGAADIYIYSNFKFI